PSNSCAESGQWCCLAKSLASPRELLRRGINASSRTLTCLPTLRHASLALVHQPDHLSGQTVTPLRC
ncbi:MAG: hypothetical protein RMJ19_08050, partial [Gemmatales bacterium]|nr:hypothetical protein [Gemmatales bacterium]MDW8175609.1 hypothetical protein [Gemmatales bacterium]